MIPQKLTISGLYSYQKEQTIDFTRLLDAQLFGIFGTVGSGKSSILEAISFAIYGETERLNSRDGRNYNMMNLKSNKLLIDFECLNFENEHWRFIVEGKRAGNDFETVRTFSRRILVKKDGEWQAVEDADPAVITGLSYDNFRRTIIIPQGKFQEFLQLGDTDRTRMLKEIFDLDKYEFSLQTKALIKRGTERRENLDGQLLQYENTNQEAINQKKEELQKQQKALAEIRGALEKKEERFNLLRSVKDKLEKREKLAETLRELQKEEEKHKALEKQLKEYEHCYSTFSEHFRQHQRLEKSIRERTENVAQLKAGLSDLKEKSGKIEAEWKKISKEYEKRDERGERLRDLETLLRIKQTEAEIGEAAEKLKKRQAEAGQLREKLTETTAKNKELKERLKELQKNKPDEQQLAAIQHWYARYGDLKDAIKAKQTESVKLKEGLEELKASFLRGLEESARETGLKVDPELTIPETIKHLSEKQNELELQLKDTQNRHNEASVQVKLEEFAENLKDGSPCPLCGSEEHPAPLHGKSGTKLDEINNLIDQLNKKLKNCRELTEKFGRLQSKSELKQEALKQAEESYNQEKQSAEEFLARFSWKEFDPESRETFDAALKQAEETRKLISETEKKQEKTESELEKQQKAAEGEREELDKLKGNLQTLRGRLDTEMEALKKLSYTDYGLTDAETISSEKEQLDELIRQTDTHYRELQTKRETVQKKISADTAKLESAEVSLQDDKKELEEVNNHIDTLLADSDFEDRAHVARILDQKLDAGAIREENEKFFRELHTTQKLKAELDEELGGQSFDPEAYEALNTEITEMKEKRDSLIGETSNTEERIKTLQNDLKKKQDLESELRILNQRLEDLDTLRKLFQSSGFVNYISSVYLHQLCDAANKRFYILTRQQLRLELTETNNFQVRDFLHDGRLRSIKTLSGGQTFQASLCLALALAETVQLHHKTKQNFFFLDEGFGSLDRESLHTVFDTLKSLRREARVVGIISHVEELQQEIDVFLRIQNDSEKGSIIMEGAPRAQF